MSMTNHETTQSAHDVPRVRYTAMQHPGHSSEDVEQRNDVAASDQSALSSQTRALQRARAVAQAAPEVRMAKVAAARRALHNGTLPLHGQDLAAKLLQVARAERRHA